MPIENLTPRSLNELRPALNSLPLYRELAAKLKQVFDNSPPAPGASSLRFLRDDYTWQLVSQSGRGYAGFEDYNDTSTAAGLAISPGVWTDVPNDGQGTFTNKSYSPGVGDLIDSSGRLVFSGLNLGDQVMIRNDIRVTPIINGAFLEWRYQLGSGAGTYYLTQPLGLLGDGAREYEFQFLQKIYIGDENTRQNLCIPQVRCTEDATFRNLGSVVTVFTLGA